LRIANWKRQPDAGEVCLKVSFQFAIFNCSFQFAPSAKSPRKMDPRAQKKMDPGERGPLVGGVENWATQARALGVGELGVGVSGEGDDLGDGRFSTPLRQLFLRGYGAGDTVTATPELLGSCRRGRLVGNWGKQPMRRKLSKKALL
jgi:hypothetical protein